MTVMLRKKVNIGGEEKEIKVFQPPGSLSRENQERAEKLDKFLADKMPALANQILKSPKKMPPMRKWYLFSKELRKIVDCPGLVLRDDVENGLIWEAVKQHLPDTIGLKGAGQAQEIDSKKWGDREHLAVCYAITHYDWKDISWLRRWDDWCKIYYRESMWKDKRILASLRKEIMSMEKYPNRAELTQILKNLAAQTTGKDIAMLDDFVISEKVHNAVKQAAHDEISTS